MDALLLARLQMAWTLSFHIVFPTLTIGLAAFLLVCEARYLRTGRAVYLDLYRWWSRVFALSFGMGVVSGIVLSYEFGTHFSRFSAATGNILGPLLTFEVLTAFFLEAGFLGVMLFGWGRVSPRVHLAATALVAAGTLISSFWIIAAGSWMHTPAGFALRDGVFYPADWWAVIFNPSFPYRLAHMVNASFLTGALLVAGVCAWHVRRGSGEFAGRGLRLGLGLLAVLAPVQIVIGDLHGLNTLKHQPMKVAAMEGHWETRSGAPFHVLAWPDQEGARNRFELSIPYAGSLILHHHPHAEVAGLDQVPPADRPRVAIVFWAFRVMVGAGLLMLTLGAWGVWRWRQGRLERSAVLLRALTWAAPLGVVATLCGWWVTEVGRQPWVVHGLMRTADAVSPVPAGLTGAALGLFVAAYLTLGSVYLAVLVRLLRAGPPRHDGTPPPAPARPAFLDAPEQAP